MLFLTFLLFFIIVLWYNGVNDIGYLRLFDFGHCTPCREGNLLKGQAGTKGKQRLDAAPYNFINVHFCIL